MELKLKEAAVCTDREFEMIKIAPEARASVEESGIENGLVYVIMEHTTTGIAVNENLDCVEKDIMERLNRIAPEDYPYHHNHYLSTYGIIEGNTPGHLRSLLTGNHCVFPIARGELKLDHIADIYFCEYDGIRIRHYMIYVVEEKKEQNTKRAIAMADSRIGMYYKLDRYYLTESSIDFASSYRDLGGDVAEMTIPGNDVFAMALGERLKERGITLRVPKYVDRPTGMATMDIVDGDKEHLHFEGNAIEGTELSGRDLEFVKPFNVVYAECWSRIDRYTRGLKQSGQVWVYNFSKRLEQEDNDLVLLYPDYAFLSYDRDDSYIRDSMVEVRKKGTGTVIVILGEHSSLAYDGDRLYGKEVERMPVVNTAGAGDFYTAAFTYGVSLGGPVPRCMDRGKEWAMEIIRQPNPYK